MRRPVASLSLDLDNQWSYMKTHGDAGWETYPSYLDVLVPRVLEFLKVRGLTITVFIVGKDASLPKNRRAIASIASEGHEIANHSFSHEPWIHLYSEEEIEREIVSAEEAIESATGRRPLGFRGPGFSLSASTLRVLARRGYLYDASTLPTFLGPLARAYYLLTSRLSREELRQREALFGSFREGLRPLRPYCWHTSESELIEIPVTTMPLFRLPIHASYVVYLSKFSRPLALAYFRAALTFCRVAGVQPSLLLHPLDFLGCDDIKELSFFPGMDLPSKRKTETVGQVVDLLAAKFTITTMHAHAHAARALALRSVEPNFPSIQI